MKQNLTAKVSAKLRERILSFDLPPRIRLSDEEIARELGISRTPVREALNRLAAEGLVEARLNRGFVVKVFDRKEVEDTYVLRERLETLAVELATPQLDDHKRKVLADLLDSFLRLMEEKDLSGFNDADERFHDLIAVYSGNSVLHTVLKNLQGKIRLIRRYDHLRPGSLEEAYEGHLDILESMTEGDAKEASKKMSVHIINAMQVVMKLMEDREPSEGLGD